MCCGPARVALSINEVPFTSVLITGASSGIGAALALAAAAPGRRFHLAGRNRERLEDVAEHCRRAGAEAATALLDVRDADALASWIRAAGQIDLAIANAGIGAGSEHGEPESLAQISALFATNLIGALNTVLAAWAAMRCQLPGPMGIRGRIGVVSSLAAFVSPPGAPTYSASKAALDRWTIGSARAARREGILLSSICPGFVRTPLTATNSYSMPLIMDAERAARLILRGLVRGQRRIVFPYRLYAATRLIDLLPPALSTWLLDRRPGKKALEPSGAKGGSPPAA